MAGAGLSTCTRQMADLLGGGLPLVRSLEIAALQTSDLNLQEELRGIRREIEAGHSLSSALSSRKETFSPVYIALVRAGESTGTLDGAFTEIATHLELDREIRQRARQSLAYPVLVLILAILVCGFLTACVIPRFQALFDDLGQRLPFPTRLLLGASDLLRTRGPLLSIFVVGGIALAPAHVRNFRERTVDWAMTRRPVRRFLVPRFTERWAHLMSVLTRGGFTVLQALLLTRRSLMPHPLARTLPELEKRVMEGASLSQALQRAGLFPPMVTELIAAGEESGRLDAALDRVARTQGRESDAALRLTTSLLEPMLILVMALLVGFVAIAMLLPIFDMSANVR